ncbi:MAG: cellulase family glycosylhydrolase, partial [Rhodospirillales bacterium]|nr:cellulase family glycosylhydrolase [Rhodospirillales bacterium]
FRFPASRDPAALRSWIGDGALATLHRVGFTFVRLPVDPALLAEPGVLDALEAALRRVHRHELAVVLSLHPVGWTLERSAADRAALRTAWDRLAPVLQRVGPRMTVAELLNEPVFPGDPAGWQAVQHALLSAVRTALPEHTIILSGQDWSSIDGLLATRPEPDGNVMYGVHLYTPAELTALAPWRSGLDRAALARLPFPAPDPDRCRSRAMGGQAPAERAEARAPAGHTTPPSLVAQRGIDAETAGVIAFYCAQGWDAARVAALVERAAAWGRQHRVPVLLGEFGATTALRADARLAWIRTVRDAAERAGMGWALWGYDDVMGFAVDRSRLRQPGPGPPLLTLGGPRPEPKAVQLAGQLRDGPRLHHRTGP